MIFIHFNNNFFAWPFTAHIAGAGSIVQQAATPNNFMNERVEPGRWNWVSQLVGRFDLTNESRAAQRIKSKSKSQCEIVQL